MTNQLSTYSVTTFIFTYENRLNYNTLFFVLLKGNLS